MKYIKLRHCNHLFVNIDDTRGLPRENSNTLLEEIGTVIRNDMPSIIVFDLLIFDLFYISSKLMTLI